MRGTLPWMAPELFPSFEGQPGASKMVNEKVDVYSFGVCLWEIWNYGAEPYPGLDAGELMYGLMYNTLRLDKSFDPSPDWIQLMELCMNRDPGLRPDFAEISWALDAMVRKWAQAAVGNPSIVRQETWESVDFPLV